MPAWFMSLSRWAAATIARHLRSLSPFCLSSLTDCRSRLVFSTAQALTYTTPHDTMLSLPPSHSHQLVSLGTSAQRYVSRHQRGQRVVDLPLPFWFFAVGGGCLCCRSLPYSLSLSLSCAAALRVLAHIVGL